MLKSTQFVTDQKGKRVGVMLDLKTYQRLLDAAEDTADIRAYRKARPKILAQVANGDAISLAQYRTKRGKA